MEITLNGKPYQTDELKNISQLLERLELNPQFVVVELNRNILTSDIFSNTEISHGDTVEIVQFVGGG